ncbi:MAG TPA: cell division ATP-binding protein FtsE [Candidatus Saccharimonadales bacterium]|nr:cell division ATP-binding protein FtsE [Candidatus Saccharimonadales bacterium]
MIKFSSVSKKYNNSSYALENLTLDIPDSEFVFLIGHSGAGKSTLLKLIIREEVPTTGKVLVDEWDVSSLPDSSVPTLRRKVGTVFQDFKLLPQRTVFENVSFPLEVLNLPDNEIHDSVMESLALVNLSEKAQSFPGQLSGGESQRTAIARAMVMRPEIILADEPTGNLDPQSAWEVMQILTKLNSLGSTIIMATHNLDITSSLAHRRVEIQKGRIVKDTKQKGSKDGSPEEAREKAGEAKN